MKSTNLFFAFLLLISAGQSRSQGTFQNLDFESPAFVPIPGDPYGRVEFGPAMPGWTGYVGTNQIDWILHNNLFLSTAGIAIWGPDNPGPEYMHGRYFVVLQFGDNPFGAQGDKVFPSLTQLVTLPADIRSIRYYTRSSIGSIGIGFGGQFLPSTLLSTIDGNYLWGTDASALAGQTGMLGISGNGYLDFIQFSAEPIPEPNTLSLFALGSLLLGWRACRRRKT